jgi:hypothetical protein
LGILEGASAS